MSVIVIQKDNIVVEDNRPIVTVSEAGAAGPAGADGQDGTVIHFAEGAIPRPGPGNPQIHLGDYLILADGSDVWLYGPLDNLEDWPPTSYQLNGPAGSAGVDGKTILSGSGSPNNGIGVNGDFYLQTNIPGYAIYGPKSGTWPPGFPLLGDDGADGKTILNGTVAPTTEGVDGDFYIDTVLNKIHGPKSFGYWGGGTSLVGPMGEPGDPATTYGCGESVADPVGIQVMWADSGTERCVSPSTPMPVSETAQDVSRLSSDVAENSLGQTLLPAVPSTVYRVLSLVMLCGSTPTEIFFSSNSTQITPTFQNGANGGAVLPYSGKVGWFETVAGQALKVTTGSGSTTGLLITYSEG